MRFVSQVPRVMPSVMEGARSLSTRVVGGRHPALIRVSDRIADVFETSDLDQVKKFNTVPKYVFSNDVRGEDALKAVEAVVTGSVVRSMPAIGSIYSTIAVAMRVDANLILSCDRDIPLHRTNRELTEALMAGTSVDSVIRSLHESRLFSDLDADLLSNPRVSLEKEIESWGKFHPLASDVQLKACQEYLGESIVVELPCDLMDDRMKSVHRIGAEHGMLNVGAKWTNIFDHSFGIAEAVRAFEWAGGENHVFSATAFDVQVLTAKGADEYLDIALSAYCSGDR